jgi:transcription antitermination factor NusG
MIEVKNQSQFRFELEQIRRAVNSAHQLDLYSGVVQGRRCRIVSGALEGIEGIVVLRKETGRVHLEVSMLGQSAVLDVDISQVEILD